MGIPFVIPEGVTLQQMWDWLEDTRSSLWFDFVRLFVWIAQDGFGRPVPPPHHEAVGNSPAEALYMLMVQYMVVPMPKKAA